MLRRNLDEEVMPHLLGREYTTMNDTKMASANSALLIIVPIQSIIEKQIIRERVGIFGSTKTLPVAILVIPERLDEECIMLKLPIAEKKAEGGNNYFVIQTSKIKEQHNEFSSHFGRDLWNDNLACIMAGGDTLRKLISSLRGEPHALRPLLVFRNTRNTFTLMIPALPCMQISRPCTCLLLKEGSEVEESHRVPPRDWSSLPCLLLWMIKERLDFFDNARVALVCSHWWHASINNPTKMQTVGDDGRPWIMIRPSPGGDKYASSQCNKNEIINIERTKRISVELPEFYDFYPFFSRQGWILFQRKYVCKKKKKKGRLVYSLLLMNPLTKNKIQLEDVVIDQGSPENRMGYWACFSNSKDGFPNCIVISVVDFDKHKISHYITTATTNPCRHCDADQVLWTKQSYVFKGFSNNQQVGGFTVIDYHVYCCFTDGVMIIYDIGGQAWREIQSPSLNQPQLFHVMEREGCVVIFALTRDLLFFKCNHTHNSWQRLANDDDINNLMIFGKQLTIHFSVRNHNGLKSYQLAHRNFKVVLLCYDFFLGKHDTPSPVNAYDASWVDIG